MAYDTIVSVNNSLPIQNNIFNKKVLVIGKRNIGKSYIIKHLIEMIKYSVQFDLVVIVSKKEEHCIEYSNQFNDVYIYFNYIDELVDVLPNLCNINKNVLVVFEDLHMMDKNNRSKMNDILRIKNMTLFASTQKLPDNNIINDFNYLLFAYDDCTKNLTHNYKKINNSFNVDTMDNYHLSMQKLSNYEFLCFEHIKNNINEFNLPIGQKFVDKFIINATIIGDNSFRNLDLIKSLICTINSNKNTKIDNIIVISKTNSHVYSALTCSVYPGVSVVRKILKEQKFNREHYLIVFDLSDDKINKNYLTPEFVFNSELHHVSCIKIINEQCDIINKFRFNTNFFIINTNSSNGFANVYSQINNQDNKLTLTTFNKICDNICNDEQCVVVTKNGCNEIYWMHFNESPYLKKYPKIRFDYVDNFRNIYDLNFDNMHDDIDNDGIEIPIIFDEHTLNSIKKLRTKNQHLFNQLNVTESLIDMNDQYRDTNSTFKQLKNHCDNIESLINTLI